MIENEHYLLDDDLGEVYYGGSKENEDRWIEEVLKQTTGLMDTNRHPDTNISVRGAHAKGFAGVNAKFTVHAGLDDWVYKGIFKPGEYNALVRFSKGSPLIKDDKEKDMHGVAIKLLDIDDPKILQEEKTLTTQDFTLCNSESFFNTDLRKYARFLRIFRNNRTISVKGAGLVSAFSLGLGGLIRVFKASNKVMINPLDEQYWSQTPQRHGLQKGDRIAVKYILKPIDNSISSANSRREQDPENHLKNLLAEHLENNDAEFHFCIQRFVDPDTTPIEDTHIAWNEEKAPATKVATLRIPKQECLTNEDFLSGFENHSFTPWHSLPEHKPLGVVNRTRRTLYFHSSLKRHKENNTQNHA